VTTAMAESHSNSSEEKWITNDPFRVYGVVGSVNSIVFNQEEALTDPRLDTALSMPAGFRFGEAPGLAVFSGAAVSARAVAAAPDLGALAAFTGTFQGNGFNTIFRPQNPGTPTGLPDPLPASDNILELNLTKESLSFSPSLGTVPNRGKVQGDISLNGVPYLQVINDVTEPDQPIGIHFEPGLWMAVPTTTGPAEGQTVVRMASIPHGTTVQAQGQASVIAGKPDIPVINITPFVTGKPGSLVPFPSQTAASGGTARIPQDLGPFIAVGTITQALLTDPATLLRTHIATQDIISTTVITISTDPTSPLFGGGTSNIAFLLGDPAASAPNAQAVSMKATFWIETVQYTIQVPVFQPGQPALVIPGETGAAGRAVPQFLVNPPGRVDSPRTVKVSATQIQYAQQVFLNFNGLTWPHVSVATLVPVAPVQVPPSAFA
jgi:hypothetical protein